MAKWVTVKKFIERIICVSFRCWQCRLQLMSKRVRAKTKYFNFNINYQRRQSESAAGGCIIIIKHALTTAEAKTARKIQSNISLLSWVVSWAKRHAIMSHFENLMQRRSFHCIKGKKNHNVTRYAILSILHSPTLLWKEIFAMQRQLSHMCEPQQQSVH